MRILDAGLLAKESKGVRSSLGVTHTLRGLKNWTKIGRVHYILGLGTEYDHCQVLNVYFFI